MDDKTLCVMCGIIPENLVELAKALQKKDKALEDVIDNIPTKKMPVNKEISSVQQLNDGWNNHVAEIKKYQTEIRKKYNL